MLIYRPMQVVEVLFRKLKMTGLIGVKYSAAFPILSTNRLCGLGAQDRRTGSSVWFRRGCYFLEVYLGRTVFPVVAPMGQGSSRGERNESTSGEEGATPLNLSAKKMAWYARRSARHLRRRNKLSQSPACGQS